METETCSTAAGDAMLDGRVLDRRRVWPLFTSGNEPGISLSSTVAIADDNDAAVVEERVSGEDSSASSDTLGVMDWLTCWLSRTSILAESRIISS